MPSTLSDRVAGISTAVAVKAPVRVATTANITLSGLQAIDGVTVVADDRVLVKNQSTTTQNGIYKANTSSWERSEDFDGSNDAVKGTRVWIVEGSTLAGQEWNLTTANPVVFDSSAIVFAQSPLQDAVAAAEAAQAAAEAAAGSVNLPAISGGDAGKALKVNAGETAFELTASALGTAALLNVGTGANQVVQLNGSSQLPAIDGSLLTGLDPVYPPGHLFGLGLSNDTDADHDIAIAVGSCVDSTNAVNLSLAAILTKQIDASWAAGDDAGGMFTGSVANATWYHLHLIRKDSDGTIDAGFDTSITAANIPVGYTAYRRLGSVLTNGSANIIAFKQNGDQFEWVTPTLDIDDNAQSTSSISRTLRVPTGLVVGADFNFFFSHASQCFVYLRPLDVTDAAPSSSAAPLYTEQSNSQSPGGRMVVRTNTSGQIGSRSSASSTTVRIATLGWWDTRGKDS